MPPLDLSFVRASKGVAPRVNAMNAAGTVLGSLSHKCGRSYIGFSVVLILASSL